ncbi:hypothetical protein ACMYSQ_001404 [Aspergillus niger]
MHLCQFHVPSSLIDPTSHGAPLMAGYLVKTLRSGEIGAQVVGLFFSPRPCCDLQRAPTDGTGNRYTAINTRWHVDYFDFKNTSTRKGAAQIKTQDKRRIS